MKKPSPMELNNSPHSNTPMSSSMFLFSHSRWGVFAWCGRLAAPLCTTPAHRTCQHSVAAHRRKASYRGLPAAMHGAVLLIRIYPALPTAPARLSSRIGCQHCFHEGLHRRLFRFEGVILTCGFGAGRAFELLLQRAAEITIDHRRMNVALPADRPGIAEQLRHGGHGIDHIAPSLGVAGELCAGQQGGGREPRAVPGAEILGREVVAGNRMQIIVDVGRVDRGDVAVIVHILEQFIARQIAATFDDASEAAIRDVDLMTLAALAAKIEMHGGAVDRDVAIAHGGEAVRAVLARIFLIADAYQCEFEQTHDGRQYFILGHARQGKIVSYPRANARQRMAEGDHAGVLGGVALAAPGRVITVLLAAARIAAGGLQMTIRQWTNPRLAPRRRNGERLDARERIGRPHHMTGRVDITKILTVRLPPYAWRAIGDVAQRRVARRLLRGGRGSRGFRFFGAAAARRNGFAQHEVGPYGWRSGVNQCGRDTDEQTNTG